MNGKIINLTPTNLSTGGIFTIAAAKSITDLADNLGKGNLSVQTHTVNLARDAGVPFQRINKTESIARSGYTPLGVVQHSTMPHWGLERLYTHGNNCYISIFCDDQYNDDEPSTIPVIVKVLYLKN